jgi:hypothetical protein
MHRADLQRALAGAGQAVRADRHLARPGTGEVGPARVEAVVVVDHERGCADRERLAEQPEHHRGEDHGNPSAPGRPAGPGHGDVDEDADADDGEHGEDDPEHQQRPTGQREHRGAPPPGDSQLGPR